MRPKLSRNETVKMQSESVCRSFYCEVASILSSVKRKHSSLRQGVFNSKLKNKAQAYRLCCEVLRFKDVLASVIDQSHFYEREKASLQNDVNLASVLVYEFLFSKREKLLCGRDLKYAVVRHATALLDEKRRLVAEGVLSEAGELLQSTSACAKVLPRYARVNTLLDTVEQVREDLLADGWLNVSCNPKNRKKFIRSMQSLDLKAFEFCDDVDFDDVFAFSHVADFYKHPLVKSGRLVLQDKSSCLAARALAPPPGSFVIDACAAPGMKSSHIAALMANSGKVFAFDRAAQRIEVMREILSLHDATCVEAICQDFLKTKPLDKRFRKVEYILVDPPCSGSGMVKRQDELTDDAQSKSEARLNALGNLQAMLLKHALSFPNAKRVVYSTCSIFERENEQVIEEVLANGSGRFQLAKALPAWRHRGRRNYPFASKCLRASFAKDATNGFFVAVLERT